MRGLLRVLVGLWLLGWIALGQTLPQLDKLVKAQVRLLPDAKPMPGPLLELQECYGLALTRHPALMSQRAQVDQAVAKLNFALAQYNPSVSGVVTRTWLTTSSFLFPIQVAQNQTQGVLNVTQTITDSGKRWAQVQGAEWALKSSYYNFHKTRLQQYQLLQQAYIQAVTAEFREQIQLENLQRNLAVQEFSVGQYMAGQKSLIDVTQSATQSTQAEVAWKSAQNQSQNARLALAQAIGVEVESLQTRRLQSLLEEPFQPPDREAALKRLEQNPNLLALESQAKFLDYQAEAQRKSLLPLLQGGIGYGLSGPESPTSTIWQAGLTLTVPFYQPGVEFQARQFDANAAQIRFDRDNLRTQLVQQLDTALSDLAWTQRRAESARLEVAQALANLQLAYKRYRAGLADFTEQINARVFVISAQGDLLTALSDRKVAEGRLQQVLGELPVAPGYDWANPGIPLPALAPEGAQPDDKKPDDP